MTTVSLQWARRGCALLYRWLRVRPDRRPFLVPVNLCRDVEATFHAAGVGLQPLDLDPRTLALDLARCAALLAVHPDRFGGVLFVRPYGAVEDVDGELAELLRIQPDLLLVDDRCLCAPDPRGDGLSAVAHATLFSTGPRKVVSAGGGGFAFLRGPLGVDAIGAEASAPAWLQLESPDEGWNEYHERIERASSPAAAHREEINSVYRELLPPEVQLPSRFQGWRFHIRVPAADELVAAIFAAGAFASRHYALVRGAAPADCPVASRLHAEVVNLFNDRHFDVRRARSVAAVVRSHLASRVGRSAYTAIAAE